MSAGSKILYNATIPLVEDSMALVKQMAGQLLTALGVWVGVVVLVSVAGMAVLRDTGYAFTTGLDRFAIVFWKCLLFVLVLDLVLCFLPFPPLGDAPLYAMISKMLAIGFGGAPVFFAVLGAISLASGRNPWEYLPGGPPFALREFARKYPHLRVETLGFGGTTVTVTNGTTGVIFDESELREAEMKWEEGCDPAEPERLGGPPPYPGGKCLARLKIRAPDYLAATNEDEDENSDSASCDFLIKLNPIRISRRINNLHWLLCSAIMCDRASVYSGVAIVGFLLVALGIAK